MSLSQLPGRYSDGRVSLAAVALAIAGAAAGTAAPRRPGPRRAQGGLTAYPLVNRCEAVTNTGTGQPIVQSYLDQLDFGLGSCPELVPDVDDLLLAILGEIDTLAELARGARGPVSPGRARASHKVT